MKLHALDIPEFGAERDAWFDEQLAGGQLPELVAELLALQSLPLARPESTPSVDDWLGTRRDAFLTGGVGKLDESQRRDLTRRPWLLLDLQAEIDAAGGDFWVDVALRSPEFAAAVAAGRRNFEQRTADGPTATSAPSHSESSKGRGSIPDADPAGPQPRTGEISRRSLGWITVLSTVAAVAIIWVGWQFAVKRTPPPAGGWGWNQSDLFAGNPTPDEYLNRLADAGAKWRNKRPETQAEVAKRIRELRAGCQRLIDGDHPPLSADQSAALKTLCRKWAGQFDEVLANLEASRQTPLEARTAIDEIVDKLVARLRSGKLA
jgi:hypothetical protein